LRSTAACTTQLAIIMSIKSSCYRNADAYELERETGIEPATLCLEGRCSTTELLPPGVYFSRAAPVWPRASRQSGGRAAPRVDHVALGVYRYLTDVGIRLTILSTRRGDDE
jgi:hypothetical protein